MSLLPPGPPIKSPLGRYRILSPTCGLRVSPLCLGTMSLGDRHSAFMGKITKSEAFALLDAFYESGGNFLDTANNYQDGQTEEWLGEWMAQRKNRDELVIATKYTMSHKQHEVGQTEHGIGANYGGNHAKSLKLSVRDSLKKLGTDYIDILYVHWYDFTSSIEEIMRSLDNLVKTGTVLYLGISACPAWLVSKANQYAKDHALTPFVVYQGLWNVMTRDLERDIVPMCIEDGLAIAPFGSIGQGRFLSQAQIEAKKAKSEIVRSYTGDGQSEAEAAISRALEKVGNEVGASLTAVAIAYVLARTPYVFPIIGGRKVEHLKDNIKALTIKLSQQQIDELESVTPFDFGYPWSMGGTDPRRDGQTKFVMQSLYLNLDWVKHTPAIQPE